MLYNANILTTLNLGLYDLTMKYNYKIITNFNISFDHLTWWVIVLFRRLSYRCISTELLDFLKTLKIVNTSSCITAGSLDLGRLTLKFLLHWRFLTFSCITTWVAWLNILILWRFWTSSCITTWVAWLWKF